MQKLTELTALLELPDTDDTMRNKILLFAFPIGLLISAIPSLADVQFTGSETACLGLLSCTPQAGTSTLGSISVPPGPIVSYTPASGFSDSIAVGNTGQVDLGTFNVARKFVGATAGTFDVDVAFTSPAGAGAESYKALLAGAVIFGDGGVEVVFHNPITKLDAFPGGDFNLSLPKDFFIADGSSKDLFATIAPLADAPEPGFTGLLGLLLAGGLVAGRKFAVARA